MSEIIDGVDIACSRCWSSFVVWHGERKITMEHGKPPEMQTLWYCCWCGNITHTEFMPQDGVENPKEAYRFTMGRFAGLTPGQVLERENGRRYLEAMAAQDREVKKFLEELN